MIICLPLPVYNEIVVEGMSKRQVKDWMLMDFSQRQRVISIGTSGVSYVILDDITWEGFRFAGLSQDLKRSDGGKEGKLIPGEDLRSMRRFQTATEV